jgi:transposase InsO family protein
VIGHLEVFMTEGSPGGRLPMSLVRYQIISSFLAETPPRGERQATLVRLAAKTWTGPDGEPVQFAAETLRSWVRRYQKEGLPGLEDKPRPQRGVQVLSPETVELACAIKKEVPARSLDRIIRILEGMDKVEQGFVRRSTLHRALRAKGLSARKARIPDSEDLDRFEAVAPNDLWQSDMLAGPWLPDPERPTKMRRAWLYAFLDDHSRLLLHGRFSFKGDLPALELVFRRALQKFGKPRRVYYDNGATYRSHHMRQIVAEIGIHGIIFTKVRRPMGHGKIEALNKYVTAAFIEEVRASRIRTLDELNEAFVAWCGPEYNGLIHGETGERPVDRWKAGLARIAWVDEEKLRLAFLWKEERTADKAGVFQLFGTEYQVGPAHARRRVEIRYDPEHTDEIEVWCDGRFAERVRPFHVRHHRRPRPPEDETAPSPTPAEPVADWLGHLVEKRRRESFAEPTPSQLAQTEADRRSQADEAVVALLAARLDPAVRDDDTVRVFVSRYGPFELDAATSAVDRVVEREGRDQHVSRYLDAILEESR